MNAVRTLTLATGLAAFVVTGSALAHCGACGVGGAKKDAAHEHAHDHAHEAVEKGKKAGSAKAHEGKSGWMSKAKKADKKVMGGGVAIGDAAPDFQLMSHTGDPVKLSDFEDQIVVLEWTNPGCPYVKRHYGEGTMKDLAAKYADEGVTWLTINSTNYMGHKDNKEFAEAHDLAQPVLADPSGRVGRMYGASTTPHMFIRHRDGTVVYAGAIDDDPRGEKDERVNYVDKALRQLLAGKPVARAETKPYGCSVKYP